MSCGHLGNSCYSHALDKSTVHAHGIAQMNQAIMYLYKLNDIMFLVKSLKSPSHFFNIYNFLSFTSSTTRSSPACQ